MACSCFPLFRENVVATCKIGSFLCSLDNLLQKKVIVFFFGNQISKWHSFEKRVIFDLLFTFFSPQGKVTKILQHISHSHTYTYFSHPIDSFCLTNFEKNMNLSGTDSLWYESWCWFRGGGGALNFFFRYGCAARISEVWGLRTDICLWKGGLVS